MRVERARKNRQTFNCFCELAVFRGLKYSGYMAFKKATESCSVELKTLLPSLLKKMEKLQQDRPQQIIDAWPSIVGEKWALLAKAASFSEGILVVKVKNSTVLSQLVQYEKQKLLKSLREKFPSHTIHEIRFCMG